MGKRRRAPDPRIDPHDPNETTPCESCQIELMILQRARELEAERGHARNIMDSLRQENELDAMWRRRPRWAKEQS
jgi:hypothetical protein